MSEAEVGPGETIELDLSELGLSPEQAWILEQASNPASVTSTIWWEVPAEVRRLALKLRDQAVRLHLGLTLPNGSQWQVIVDEYRAAGLFKVQLTSAEIEILKGFLGLGETEG